MANDDAKKTGQDEGDVAGSWYADRFRVGQNAFEFKVDCGHEREDNMTPQYFRVIANPANARELFRQLGVGLLHYSDRFGTDEPGTGGKGDK